MDNVEQNLPPQTVQARRRWITLGVAAAAAVAGAGIAWRSTEREALAKATNGSGANNGAGSTGEQAFWDMRFDAPTSDVLTMKAFLGKPLLLNFWATWCPPCVDELPLLDRFFSENRTKGWQVLGLAIDQPTAVRKFLQKTQLSFPVAMGGLEGTEISRTLGNSTGSLPFSVVFNAQGQIVHRKMGTLGAAELQNLLKAYTPT